MKVINRSVVALVVLAALKVAWSNGLNQVIKDCNACHGEAGNSELAEIPTIAGFSEFYLDESLRVYRDKARPCAESAYPASYQPNKKATMCQLAANLSNDQIATIAKHYAAQSFKAAKQSFDPKKAELGAKIHQQQCEKCHAAGGSDPADDAGLLAGQWMPYLKQTFSDYDTGAREQPKKMAVKFNALDATSREALLHYYASLQ